jgi:hypothetical protein
LVATTIGLGGCKLSIGGGDDDDDDVGGGISAGFSWTWEVVDYATDAKITCEAAGAYYTVIQITDSESVSHEIWWYCEDGEGETDSWDIATGPAKVTASLVTWEESVLSKTDAFDFEFESGELRNDLGHVIFPVDLWDPRDGADASLVWEWRVGDADASEPMSEEACAEQGFDSVSVWIWNPEVDDWWTYPEWNGFPCGAFEHEGDEVDGAYSGLRIDEFVVAGEYELLLAFYGEGEDGSETLLASFTAGTAGDEYDGALAADGETEDGFNHYVSYFESEEPTILGVLPISLVWQQSQGGTFDTCSDSTMESMGYWLTNWDGLETATEEGIECLDELVFDGVPVEGESGYDLVVEGVSDEGVVLWYGYCSDLVPTADTPVEEIEPYVCEIANELANE